MRNGGQDAACDEAFIAARKHVREGATPWAGLQITVGVDAGSPVQPGGAQPYQHRTRIVVKNPTRWESASGRRLLGQDAMQRRLSCFLHFQGALPAVHSASLTRRELDAPSRCFPVGLAAYSS